MFDLRYREVRVFERGLWGIKEETYRFCDIESIDLDKKKGAPRFNVENESLFLHLSDGRRIPYGRSEWVNEETIERLSVWVNDRVLALLGVDGEGEALVPDGQEGVRFLVDSTQRHERS